MSPSSERPQGTPRGLGGAASAAPELNVTTDQQWARVVRYSRARSFVARPTTRSVRTLTRTLRFPDRQQADRGRRSVYEEPIPDCPEHLVGIEIDGEAVDQDAISDGLLNFFQDHQPIVEMAESTVAVSLEVTDALGFALHPFDRCRLSFFGEPTGYLDALGQGGDRVEDKRERLRTIGLGRVERNHHLGLLLLKEPEPAQAGQELIEVEAFVEGINELELAGCPTSTPTPSNSRRSCRAE